MQRLKTSVINNLAEYIGGYLPFKNLSTINGSTREIC